MPCRCSCSTAYYYHTSLAIERHRLETNQCDLGAGWVESLMEEERGVGDGICIPLVCGQLEQVCCFGEVLWHTCTFGMHHTDVVLCIRFCKPLVCSLAALATQHTSPIRSVGSTEWWGHLCCCIYVTCAKVWMECFSLTRCAINRVSSLLLCCLLRCLLRCLLFLKRSGSFGNCSCSMGGTVRFF